MFKRTTICLTLLFVSSVCLRSEEGSSVTNLGLAGGWYAALSGNWLAFTVSERHQGEDLNGDGDMHDQVPHVRDLESGETINLRLAGSDLVLSDNWLAFQGDAVYVMDLESGETTNLANLGLDAYCFNGCEIDVSGNWLAFQGEVLYVMDLESGETTNLANLGLAGGDVAALLSGNWLVFDVSEWEQDEDLNGDGDMGDSVLHVHDLEFGETTNVGLAGDYVAALSGNRLVFEVLEEAGDGQGEDLNGDGDMVDRLLHMHNLESGETKNLGLGGDGVLLSGNWLAFTVSERGQGEDLNGDGDMVDGVLHVRDLEAGETTNLGIAGSGSTTFSGNWLAFAVRESYQGEDLNGDGDMEDNVVHVRDLRAGATTNLGLDNPCEDYCELALSDKWLAFEVSEDGQGEDLDGDGDMDDFVLHLRDLEAGETANLGLAGSDYNSVPPVLSGNWLVFEVSEDGRREDLNGDGDMEDRVLHVDNLESGETTNLGLAASVPGSELSGNWLKFVVFEEDQGEDLNGDGDRRDAVLHVVDLSAFLDCLSALLDCNGNGTKDAEDIANGVSIDSDGNCTPDECQRPMAHFTLSSETGGVPLEVEMDGSLSEPAFPEYPIVSYRWDFGDGHMAEGMTLRHTYADAGRYEIRLTVENDQGGVDSETERICVGCAEARFEVATSGSTLRVEVNAEESTAAHGTTVVSYNWNFGDGTTAEGVTVSHTYESPGRYEIQLTVVNDFGWSDSETQLIALSCPSSDLGPWSSVDVGQPLIPGGARADGESLSICATGKVLSPSRREDSLHFVYQELSGNRVVKAQIRSVEGPESAQVGVMFRESLDADARQAAMVFRRSTTGDSLGFYSRDVAGARMEWVIDRPPVVELPNVWVQIERHGDDLIGSTSTDGIAWKEVGRVILADFPESVYGGLVVIGKEPSDPPGPFEILRTEIASLELSDILPTFRRADANADGVVDQSDAITNLERALPG